MHLYLGRFPFAMRLPKPLLPLLASAALSLPAAARAAVEPALSADDFVDRIGVATHLGYDDTPYGFAYDKASQMLGESGIRHIRDGLHPRELDLFNRFGIKSTVIVGPPQDPRQSLKALEPVAETIDMIEGPNEVDIFPQNGQYKGRSFPEGARLFQDDLYAAVHENARLRGLGVIALSTARADSNLKLSPLHSFDYLVMHSYAGGQMPSSSLDGPVISNIRNAPRLLGKGDEVKPIVVTESGYHTALGANLTLGGVQPGVSEEVQRKYLPRHFAEYFNAGIARTISYEFLDEFPDEATNAEASFGMVRRDLSPKPAYTALKNLIAMLSESKWDAQARKWKTPIVRPHAVNFELVGAPADVHHTLLQKSDGSYYLLLWREASSWDTAKQQEIPVAPARVEVRFGLPIPGAQLFNLKSAAPVGNWSNTRSLVLDVPDEIVVLKLGALYPRQYAFSVGMLPPVPRAQPSGDSLSLSWAGVPRARGYFVWQGLKYLGSTREPRFRIGGLAPGMSYRLRVQSFDMAGNVSPTHEFVASTLDVSPDLVVSSVSLDPAKPRAGQGTRLKATIENRGTAPTPEGTTLGVAFFVDTSGIVAWSDTFKRSLKPGEKIELVSNNGPNKSPMWIATAGAHTLRAQVDDVNRIDESDENNNTREAAVTVE